VKKGLLFYLACGFPLEFELLDNSGNIFCLNSNGSLKGHDNGNNCDDDYKQTGKHKFYAKTILQDGNIPSNMCVLFSKNGNTVLEMNGENKEIRRSNDDNTMGAEEKYFRAIPVENGRFRILNTRENKYLKKEGSLLKATQANDCGNDCHFVLKIQMPSSTTQTTGFH